MMGRSLLSFLLGDPADHDEPDLAGSLHGLPRDS